MGQGTCAESNAPPLVAGSGPVLKGSALLLFCQGLFPSESQDGSCSSPPQNLLHIWVAESVGHFCLKQGPRHRAAWQGKPLLTESQTSSPVPVGGHFKVRRGTILYLAPPKCQPRLEAGTTAHTRTNDPHSCLWMFRDRGQKSRQSGSRHVKTC